MKRLAILTTAATLLLSTAAFAAPYHQGTDSHRAAPQQSHEQRYDLGRKPDRERRDTNRVRRDTRAQVAWRYGGPVDWRAYRLRQPPAGYHWVHTANGFVLVQIPNALVLNIDLGR